MLALKTFPCFIWVAESITALPSKVNVYFIESNTSSVHLMRPIRFIYVNEAISHSVCTTFFLFSFYSVNLLFTVVAFSCIVVMFILDIDWVDKNENLTIKECYFYSRNYILAFIVFSLK